MIRPVKEFMDITNTSGVKIAKMTGSHQQVASKRIAKGNMFVDWNMHTGEVKKIWTERVLFTDENKKPVDHCG